MTNTLINVDLSQAELRVMALLSNDPWMISALQVDSGDFFSNHFMPAAFPVQYESYGSTAEWERRDPMDFKERRVQTKSVMYGLAFARSAKAIGEEIGQPTIVAQNIIDSLFEKAPLFARWREEVQEAAVDPSKRDMLVSVFGRRYQREIITSGAQAVAVKREALAFLPQSTASDICLSTAIRVHGSLKDAGYHIFNVVHDAIMVEGPLDDATTIAQYIGYELAQTGLTMLGDRVPFLSDYSIGKHWGELS